jgi:hypothetical protein
MSRPRRIPDKGDVSAPSVAERLGLTLSEFEERRHELEQRGFPQPDETTGRYCIEAVDQWRLCRFPQFFAMPTIEGPKTDRATARTRISKL